MAENEEDPAEKERRALLARVYRFILSLPDPRDETPAVPDYCTQNDGDCAACPLANGELDCRNNKFPVS
jgi:hypothetical protein